MLLVNGDNDYKTNTLIRSVAVNRDFDGLIEQTRKRLNMSRSGFYKYAVRRLLQDLSVLSETAHKGADLV